MFTVEGDVPQCTSSNVDKQDKQRFTDGSNNLRNTRITSELIKVMIDHVEPAFPNPLLLFLCWCAGPTRAI